MTLALGRPVGKRTVHRAFNAPSAAAVLREAEFGPGREVFGFNGGQFSSVDLIEALVDVVGGGDLTIATWTAAAADLNHVAAFIKRGRLRRVCWIVDRSFKTRQPALCAMLRESFGDEAIRVAETHAKFALLSGGDWRIVVQTSMNLNMNRRIESFWVADDPELFEGYAALVADVFKLQPAGAGFDNHAAAAKVLDGLREQERQGTFFDVKPGRSIL